MRLAPCIIKYLECYVIKIASTFTRSLAFIVRHRRLDARCPFLDGSSSKGDMLRGLMLYGSGVLTIVGSLANPGFTM